MVKRTFIISIFLIFILAISFPILATEEDKPKFEKGLSLDPQSSEGAQNIHGTNHNTTTESKEGGLSLGREDAIRIGPDMHIWVETIVDPNNHQGAIIKSEKETTFKPKKVVFSYNDSSIPQEYRKAIKWFWENAQNGESKPLPPAEEIVTKVKSISQLYDNPDFYLNRKIEIQGERTTRGISLWRLKDNTGQIEVKAKFLEPIIDGPYFTKRDNNDEEDVSSLRLKSTEPNVIQTIERAGLKVEQAAQSTDTDSLKSGQDYNISLRPKITVIGTFKRESYAWWRITDLLNRKDKYYIELDIVK
ncbi:MAG: hypothetical protein ACOCQR_02720 [bacterium]